MAWLNGRIERQLVTALLLIALLVSCGVAGRTGQLPGSADPTATVEDPPTIAAGAPTEAPPAATTGASGAPSTGASAPGAPSAQPPTAATAQPSAPAVPPTPTRAPSTSPLATKRLVTFYGNPYSDKMGILGEYDNPEEMVAKLKEQTAAYTAADPSRPAQCTIELIASMATSEPGSDGLWLLRLPTAKIEQYAQLAERQGCELLLDIQMGYDTVANDIQAILPFLQRPFVHLAIDPEFRVDPGEVPGENYGSITAADVAYAGKVLGDLVRQYNLPDKVLVVHQFRDDMLPDKAKITPMPNIDLVLVMDGWGDMASKVNNYDYFVREQLIQYGGLKIFYRQDEPVMTPEQVLELDPQPLVIIYQ